MRYIFSDVHVDPTGFSFLNFTKETRPTVTSHFTWYFFLYKVRQLILYITYTSTLNLQILADQQTTETRSGITA